VVTKSNGMFSLGRLVTIVAVLVSLAGVFVAAGSGPTTTSRAISGRHGVIVPHSEFYLDIGGSASRGTQPNSLHNGDINMLTDEGYSNDVVLWAQSHGVSLTLTEVGCGGETTRSMISGNDRCYRGDGSQLDSAVAFLRAHRDDSGLVTIDLGFNDIIHCMSTSSVRETCVRRHIVALRHQLRFILRALIKAKGPRVTLIGVGHYDPFLDSYQGVVPAKVARMSVWATRVLDATLIRTYRHYGVEMAEVGSAFRVGDVKREYSHGRRVPEDALQVCRMTWMCHHERGGPNYHPNDRGYRVIAHAIVKELVRGSGVWREMSKHDIGA
jgi:hypothetical protein